ncbi:hypothetical protein HMPREF9104_03229 [Lentilactobacillus kisonensis F0435]|uniref:Uncharacterized protein n=1 Tax=Lentilactobacillus kisonensis F0435 TaxID=797516 RepID=H1LKS5_9LACO|nr:hypothetical protein HMPREF9104_03229 [Lentilactobacillus kisonensis F0435]
MFFENAQVILTGIVRRSRGTGAREPKTFWYRWHVSRKIFATLDYPW